ncbi:hypothetical protein CYLTODRAFT_460624, partial [Cylindrobasidium torrendii FP15055 ss-10]
MSFQPSVEVSVDAAPVPSPDSSLAPATGNTNDTHSKPDKPVTSLPAKVDPNAPPPTWNT